MDIKKLTWHLRLKLRPLMINSIGFLNVVVLFPCEKKKLVFINEWQNFTRLTNLLWCIQLTYVVDLVLVTL